jgi:hypothetical protein
MDDPPESLNLMFNVLALAGCFVAIVPSSMKALFLSKSTTGQPCSSGA